MQSPIKLALCFKLCRWGRAVVWLAVALMIAQTQQEHLTQLTTQHQHSHCHKRGEWIKKRKEKHVCCVCVIVAFTVCAASQALHYNMYLIQAETEHPVLITRTCVCVCQNNNSRDMVQHKNQTDKTENRMCSQFAYMCVCACVSAIT